MLTLLIDLLLKLEVEHLRLGLEVVVAVRAEPDDLLPFLKLRHLKTLLWDGLLSRLLLRNWCLREPSSR